MKIKEQFGTYFENGAKNVFPKALLTFEELAEGIKSDKMANRHTILQNLKKNNFEDYVKMKLNSPYVCMNGVFERREDNGMDPKTFNWVIPWDIDGKDNPEMDLDKTRVLIEKTPSTVLCCRSTGGNGIRGFSLLKKEAFQFERSQYYHKMKDVVLPYLEKKWYVKLDPAQCRLSQPWFMTYDPDVFTNWEAVPISKEEVDYSYVSIETLDDQADENSLKSFGTLKPFLEGISRQKDQKHNYLLRVGRLMGGLFAGGVFDKKLKEEKIVEEVSRAINKNGFIQDYGAAKDTWWKSFKYGKKDPINKDTIKVQKSFKDALGKIEYRITQSDPATGKFPYIRVGNDFWKVRYEEEKDGLGNSRKIRQLHPWKRQTLIDDYGPEIVKYIPQFIDFINDPDYVHYQEFYNSKYNLANPLVHVPKKGDWPTIKSMFKHIFGDQYRYGVSYVQQLIRNPKQLLPVLCLVSRENVTGKTTFIDFLDSVFHGNMAIISTGDFESQFNRYWITKNVIAIDESELDGRANSSRIKQYATQKKANVNEKFVSPTSIDFYGKFIILSNNERNFIKINDNDERYWVVKTPKIKSFDPNYLKKLKEEIPAFLFDIINSKLLDPVSKSRLWFDMKDLNTEALEGVKEANKSAGFFHISEIFENYFNQHPDAKEIRVKVSDILKADPHLERMGYSFKGVGEVLRNEFNIHPKGQIRFINSFTGEEDNSTPFVINRDHPCLPFKQNLNEQRSSLFTI